MSSSSDKRISNLLTVKSGTLKGWENQANKLIEDIDYYYFQFTKPSFTIEKLEKIRAFLDSFEDALKGFVTGIKLLPNYSGTEPKKYSSQIAGHLLAHLATINDCLSEGSKLPPDWQSSLGDIFTKNIYYFKAISDDLNASDSAVGGAPASSSAGSLQLGDAQISVLQQLRAFIVAALCLARHVPTKQSLPVRWPAELAEIYNKQLGDFGLSSSGAVGRPGALDAAGFMANFYAPFLKGSLASLSNRWFARCFESLGNINNPDLPRGVRRAFTLLSSACPRFKAHVTDVVQRNLKNGVYKTPLLTEPSLALDFTGPYDWFAAIKAPASSTQPEQAAPSASPGPAEASMSQGASSTKPGLNARSGPPVPNIQISIDISKTFLVSQLGCLRALIAALLRIVKYPPFSDRITSDETRLLENMAKCYNKCVKDYRFRRDGQIYLPENVEIEDWIASVYDIYFKNYGAKVCYLGAKLEAIWKNNKRSLPAEIPPELRDALIPVVGACRRYMGHMKSVLGDGSSGADLFRGNGAGDMYLFAQPNKTLRPLVPIVGNWYEKIKV